MSMSRRAFLTWVGVGGLASSLPVALAACSSDTEQTEAAATKEFQSVGSVAELDKTGFLLNKKSPVGSVLVVRTPEKKLIAVNPTCTHAGCTVAWVGSAKKFACPCHQAEFGVDGKVLKGPATKPLKTYQAKLQGTSVLVKQA